MSSAPNVGVDADVDDADREKARLQLALSAVELIAKDNVVRSLILKGAHGHTRDALLTRLTQSMNCHRLPTNTDADTLRGGLDACASIAEGAAVHTLPFLQRPDIDCVILCNAERWSNAALQALKSMWEAQPDTTTRLVALDESGDEEQGFTESSVADLFTLHVDVGELPYGLLAPALHEFDEGRIQPAANPGNRPVDLHVSLDDAFLRSWIQLAQSLDIPSMRAVHHCVCTAKALAAVSGRDRVDENDSVTAVQLVLGPRARRMLPDDTMQQDSDDQSHNAEDTPEDTPQDNLDNPNDEQADTRIDDTNADTNRTEPPEQSDAENPEEASERDINELPETLINAVQATLPAHLLAGLAANQRQKNAESGRDKSTSSEAVSGRPIGVRRAKNYARGERLNILATLQQAAPWQRMRKRSRPDASADCRIVIHPDDLRVTRFASPVRNTTVFIVDASGSAALNRLAEAKGAVELLLNECYVRRDRVALITFRGSLATLDLPPTRSLVRAKRALQGLPGGGGTPLASGLAVAEKLLLQLGKTGESTVGVVLSDGKANVGIDGTKSRPLAREDALRQAKALRALDSRLIFVDTSARPHTSAREIADAMGAQYLPLPHGQQHVLAGRINASAVSA